jgi:hypothetical protein
MTYHLRRLLPAGLIRRRPHQPLQLIPYSIRITIFAIKTYNRIFIPLTDANQIPSPTPASSSPSHSRPRLPGRLKT